MEQNERFVVKWQKKKFYKLVKSLYGLEQVPKYCDSQSAIERTQSSMYNGMSRHVHHRYNIVKHLLLNKINFIDYVKSKKIFANQKFI
jgi:hypothetical protein